MENGNKKERVCVCITARRCAVWRLKWTRCASGWGWKLEDLEKPKVIIESTFGDSHPGSAHLLKFVDTAAAGVAAAGGRAARYFTTGYLRRHGTGP